MKTKEKLKEKELEKVNGGIRYIKIKQDCPYAGGVGCKYTKDTKTNCSHFEEFNCCFH